MPDLLEMLGHRAKTEGVPLRLVIKEALQLFALEAIFRDPLSRRLTFQGGTCLRLIYGGGRYSEDLDFVTELDPEERKVLLQKISPSLQILGPFFGAELLVRLQKDTETFTRWKLTLAGRISLSISVELARYPAYTLFLAPPRVPADLPSLPFFVIRAEKEEELLADKVVALAGRGFFKGRDVFDIWFLSRKGIRPDRELVRKKLEDYRIPLDDLKRALREPELKNLDREMAIYVPSSIRGHLNLEKEVPGILAVLRKELV